MGKRQGPSEFVRIALGSLHLAFAHYCCVGTVMALLEDALDIPTEMMTVYSLKEISPSGMPINYNDLECQIDHEHSVKWEDAA